MRGGGLSIKAVQHISTPTEKGGGGKDNGKKKEKRVRELK